jgi:hypothetical protein
MENVALVNHLIIRRFGLDTDSVVASEVMAGTNNAIRSSFAASDSGNNASHN